MSDNCPYCVNGWLNAASLANPENRVKCQSCTLERAVETLQCCNATLHTDGRRVIAIMDSDDEAKELYFALLDIRG